MVSLQQYKDGLIYVNQFVIIHHTMNSKTNHMIISLDTEKGFDKTLNILFRTKVMEKLEVERAFLNLIKAI